MSKIATGTGKFKQDSHTSTHRSPLSFFCNPACSIVPTIWSESLGQVNVKHDSADLLENSCVHLVKRLKFSIFALNMKGMMLYSSFFVCTSNIMVTFMLSSKMGFPFTHVCEINREHF